MRHPRRDVLDEHPRTQERVRRLEVLPVERFIAPRYHPVTHTELDILTDLVTMFGAWDTFTADRTGFGGHPVCYTANQLAQKLYREGWEHWTALARDFYHLLQDVSALPSQAYWTQIVPVRGGWARGQWGEPDFPYIAYYDVTKFVTGGQIDGSISWAGVGPGDRIRGVQEKALYLRGDMPDPNFLQGYDLTHYQFLHNTSVGSPLAGSSAKCDVPPLPPAGSAQVKPGVTGSGYAETAPYRSLRGQWAVEPGVYMTTKGNENRYFVGSNGQYMTADQVYPCGDVEAEDTPFGKKGIGSPLGAWIGSEMCPNNPTGDYTLGCTGVIVTGYWWDPWNVYPVIPPVPVVAPPGEVSPTNNWSDNYYGGYGSYPSIGFPGFVELRERIAACVNSYPNVLQFMNENLPAADPIDVGDGLSQPAWGRLDFPQDGRWINCPIIAPYIGSVQARVIGQKVEFRGHVVTWNHPKGPIIFLPHGLPLPGVTGSASYTAVFLATGAEVHGPPIPMEFVGGQDFTQPRKIGKTRVPLYIQRITGNEMHSDPLTKWYLSPQGHTSGTPLGNEAGTQAVILDGMSYIPGGEGLVT